MLLAGNLKATGDADRLLCGTVARYGPATQAVGGPRPAIALSIHLYTIGWLRGAAASCGWTCHRRNTSQNLKYGTCVAELSALPRFLTAKICNSILERSSPGMEQAKS